MGTLEVNHLANTGCQSEAMAGQNCPTVRLCLKKCGAIGGAYSYSFSSYCLCASFKTSFCPELLHTMYFDKPHILA
jgi:hypothetical protein